MGVGEEERAAHQVEDYSGHHSGRLVYPEHCRRKAAQLTPQLLWTLQLPLFRLRDYHSFRVLGRV